VPAALKRQLSGQSNKDRVMDNGVNALIAQARWVVRSVRHRRWLVLAVAWAIAIVSAIGISLAPERFEASSRIYVDTQTVLKPMMIGLAFQPDIEQQVRMLARTLISRPNVERLLARPEIGFTFTGPAEREKTLTRLMEQIKIVAAERGNLYTISYRDTSRERALQMVEGTVALFVNSGADGKKQDSVEAGRFIDEQIRSNEAKLIAAEGRLKDFKVRNFGVSGVSNQDYFSRMSVLSDEVTKLRSDLRAAEQARDAYRRELAAEDPQLPVESLPGTNAPAVALEVDARLDSQRKQLDDLLRRFTDDHPDVINARRLVAQLEQQRRQELEARARESGGRTKGTAATSPVYQRIRVSLAESEAQVASLRSQLAAQTGRLEQIRALAGRAPQVEAELAQLNRDYDVMRKNYDQLVARRESASLGVKLDESSQLADFRVVEPARVSPSPVFPGRLHLALFAVALALVAGVASALAMDALRPTVDDSKSLELISGRPVLGAVSIAKTQKWHHVARQNAFRFAGAAALLLTFQLGWVAWVAVRPLAQ
jgi:polysaccharide chain length determinant protein (PEP-CTERM system associated)